MKKLINIWRNQNTETQLGTIIIGVILALSILVPALSPYSSLKSSYDILQPPSSIHLFGTDHLGRDVFTRTFAAVQIDLGLAIFGVSLPLVVGTFIGAVLGTTNSALITLIWMMIIDAITAFPRMVIVLAIVIVVGPGAQGLIIALSLTNWARYAKISRARALALRETEFLDATQVLGYSRIRVLFRHIFPNVYSETLAYGLSDFVLVILAIASLSFLGAGVRPPTPEWGSMMSEGRHYLVVQWWATVFPGLALTATAIGIALLAEGIVGRFRGEG
jgi:peptide/nickel transport system permease protein